MLIVCPNCATSYRIDPSSLGAAGRSVRCARCKNTWFAANTEAAAAVRSAQESAALAMFGAESHPAPEPFSPDASAPDAFPALDATPQSVPAGPQQPERPETLHDDRGPAPLREALDEPSPMPTNEIQPPAISESPSPEPTDIESAAWRVQSKAARRRAATARRRWAAVILILLAVNAGLIGWRAEVVRLVPQTAPLYAAIGLPVNLRGLAFAEISTRKEEQDGVPMLVIEGTIKSTSRRTADVPRLRFAVRNAQGQEIHAWTALPANTVLAPGDVLPFRTRLASPPPEAHAVLVRFWNRRDLVAGSQ
jgi:predicted Zn finger-like uncharacterized protein